MARLRKQFKISKKHYYFSKLKNIFKYIYNILKNLFQRSSCLYATGSHIITGYPGSGKTLLMNKIINNVDSEKYFFYTNIDEFNQNNVYKIDLDKIFNDKKQVAKLPTKDKKGRYLYGLILDEINLNFNRRVNQSRDYTNLFIGLIEMVITHRHQNIPRLYFIGQKLDLQDGQLITLFKYQHDIVKSTKHFRYWRYYTEHLEKVPVKLKVLNRVKDIDDNFVEMDYTKVKINWCDLVSYNTFGLKNVYENLPVYKLE